MSRVDWNRYPDDVEPVVAILLGREYGATRIRPSRGDGGIDLIVPVDERGGVDVYQVKRFATNLTSGQKRQIENSYKRILTTIKDRGLLIRSWHLTLPLDHTPENLTWLQELTQDAPFKSTWKGLNIIDGLAAKYPDVIDHYLHDGADRLARVVQDLTALLRRGSQADREQPQLRPSDVEADLASMYRALNAHDPHYRYSFRVDDRPPAASDEPDLVVQREIGWPGLSITHYVFARYPDATRDQPIRIRLRISAQEGSQLASDLESFHKFGTPLTAPADFDLQMPAGLGLLDAAGRVTINPLGADGAKPYVIRLQVIDGGRAEIALVRLNMQPITHGLSGQGIRSCGREEHGVFDCEIRLSHEDHTGRIHFSEGVLDGLAPADVLPGLRFIAACHPPNSLRVGLAYGPMSHAPLVLPDEGANFQSTTIGLSFRIQVAEALSNLQNYTGTQLTIPDLTTITTEDLAQWRKAAALLAGETVEFAWEYLEFPVNPDILEPFKNEYGFQLGLDAPLEVKVGDHTIPLGTQRIMYASAQLDQARGLTPDGPLIHVRVIPGRHSDRASSTLIPDGAEDNR